MASKNISSPNFLNICLKSKSGLDIMPSFTVVWSVLLFPISFLVLHTGFQRWRQNKRSTVSHADFFTYNILLFNLVNYSSYVVFSIGSLVPNDELIRLSTSILCFATPGLLSLHVLTCVELYLAVVYPVVYLSLKEQKWIRVRNVTAFVIWLFCPPWTAMVIALKNSLIPLLIMLGISSSIISFCSVQVLRSLMNPSPGEGRRVSQSKRKAFFTMLAVLSALLLYLTGGVVYYVLENADLLGQDKICKIQKSMCWSELPSSLVLPLLFLHRAKKLPKCRGKKIRNHGLELRG